MTDFPTLSYTATNKPFIYLKLHKGPPLRAEPPRIGHYGEYPPVLKLKKSYVDAKEEPIYLYENVYESWSYCMTLYMTH